MEKPQNKRHRPAKQWFFIGGAVLIVCFFAIALALVINKKNQTGMVRTTAMDTSTGTSSRGIEESPRPEYARKLEEQRQLEIEAARQQGATYVSPVVVGQGAPATDLSVVPEPPRIDVSELPPPPEITVAQPQTYAPPPVNPAQQYADARSQELTRAIQQTLVQVASRQVPQAHTIQVLPAAKSAVKDVAEATTAVAAPVTSTVAKEVPPFQVGDVLYAVIEQYLNTDTPVPAFLATVISGPLKGAKVIGQFTRVEDRMTLLFQRLVHNNKVWTINGYAVDPKTTSGALASSVDYHRMSRWGGLIAASLLKGWASAVEKSGQTVAISDGTVVSGVPNYSFLDEMIIASGEVGSQLAEKASKNFDRVPTVHLEQGVPVGIVIMSVN